MKSLLLSFLLVPLMSAPALAGPVQIGGDPVCAQGRGPALQVSVAGLADRTGRMKLELYPANEADFLKGDKDLQAEGKFFRRVWAAIPQSGVVTLCIRAPRPGRYALLVTHDRDGANKFNFWRDGAGFVSNQPLGRARPSVNLAAVGVGAGVTRVSVRMQYLQGISGFGPN